jgi:hypothetical protein
MPRVSIATGFRTEDGREEILAEYLCDVADCPNPAAECWASCASSAAAMRSVPSTRLSGGRIPPIVSPDRQV